MTRNLRSWQESGRQEVLGMPAPEPRRVLAREAPWRPEDPAVWELAGKYLDLARERRIDVAVSRTGLYRELLLQIEATGMRQLGLRATDGSAGWPIVLEHMIELYYDGEIDPENSWNWKSFTSPKNFDRLLKYSLWQLHMSRQQTQETEPVTYSYRPDPALLERQRVRQEEREETARRIAARTEEVFAGTSREDRAAMFATAMEETRSRQKARKAQAKKGNVN